MLERKYQIFLSSTFKELEKERQKAIFAILDSGHIPAGMEIFRPGLTKWETIKRWIDTSDIYLLILGGRYGDIEKNEEYSYIEREYRYAESKGMPVLTLCLSNEYLADKAKNTDINIYETDNVSEYKAFKKYVCKNICRTVRNINDICSNIPILIQAAIELKKDELIGWIREEHGIRRFKTIDEVDEYIAKRIREAKNSVKDFTWRDYYPDTSKPRNRSKQLKLQEDFLTAIQSIDENVDYREIFSFPKNSASRLQKMKVLFNQKNYYCCFYKSQSNAIFPKLHFVIIDDEEVIFVSSQYKHYLCSTTNENIVGIMNEYYDEAWELAINVKDVYKINEENIQIAEAEFQN